VRKQPVRGQPLRRQTVRNQPIRSQPVKNQPIRDQLDRSQTVKNTTSQAIPFPTTPIQTSTPPTTSSEMPLKIMSTIFPVTDEITIIPTILDEEPLSTTASDPVTESSSVQETLSASKEALALGDQETQLNEIQTDVMKGSSPLALTRFLLPPTRSFSAGMQEQEEVTTEDAPDPDHMMLLSRKEPVSWA